ncbi:MAG: AAA family ATPase [Finegoldia magna]|nr:AAA family ATPase [Finegoldia magna]
MYITDIYLTNFQSYEQGHFELSEKVNLITGASDSGKTALIRALSWVLFNDYTTDLLIRNGYNNVEVKIVFNNGNFILRGRKGNTNYYYIKNNPDSEDIKKYENFGREIPSEIQNDFLFKKVNLLNEKYNILIASQLENSFLLSETDSTKANAIGKLVNIDILDNASRNVSREIKSTKGELNFKKSFINEKEESLNKYNYLNEDKIKIDNLRVLYNNLAKNFEKLNILKTLSIKLSGLNVRIKNGYKYLDKYKGLDICSETLQNTEDNISSFSKLNQLYEYYQQIIKGIKSSNVKLNNLRYTDLISEIIDSIDKNLTLLKFLKPLHERFTYVNSSFKNYESKLEKFKQVHKSYNILLNTQNDIQILNQLSNLNENYYRINQEIRDNSQVLTSINTSKVSELTNRIYKNKEKYIQLYKLSISYQKVNHMILEKNDKLNKLKSIKTLQNIIFNLYKTSELLAKLKIIKATLDDKENIYQQNTKVISKCNIVIGDLIQKYKENLYKEKICPFCLSEIDEEHVTQIVKELRK